MEPNYLFPQIVEEYKNHLRADAVPHRTLKSFCFTKGVRYTSLSQWLSRRGLSVATLRYQILSEKCGHSPEQVFERLKKESRIVLQDTTGKGAPIPLCQRLKGVALNFPDGTQIHIREATPAALVGFIKCYYQYVDSSYVRPE